MITTIVSDFGGVLSSPLWPAFALVQEEFGIPADALNAAMEAVHEERGVHPLAELECGRMAEADFHAALEAQLARQLGRPVGMHRFTELYWGALTPNEPVIALLRELRGAGYRLALLTNNVREWEPRWRAMLPVDELFEVVVDSAFVGLRKPDHEIYRLTCSRLGVEPSECLFLDDFEVNCAAAEEVGMVAVRFADTDQALRDVRAVLAERGAPAQRR